MVVCQILVSKQSLFLFFFIEYPFFLSENYLEIRLFYIMFLFD